MNKNVTHTYEIILSYISQLWNIGIQQNDTFHLSYTMVEEYNTHTQTHTCAKHIDILLLTLFFASIAAPAPRSNLTMPVWPILEDSKSAVLSLWWMKKERKKEKKKEGKKEK